VQVAVLFPGQGAQASQLGAAWVDHPSFAVVDALDGVLAGEARSLLLDAPADVLARTRPAQLCVFAASLIVWDAVRRVLPDPVAFAGHSLGQITALVASGALDVAAGAALADARAHRTQDAADASPGRLAALLGASIEDAEAACAAAPAACWVANDNAPGQVVIGGTPEGLDAAGAAARAAGVRRVTPLAVGGAFHTPLMAPAAAEFARDLEAVDFVPPSAPIVTNTDATAHRDSDGWPARLTQHLVQRVRWRESVEDMVRSGADTFVEVGPGGVLTGLVRRIAPDVAVHSVATPSDVAELAAQLTPAEVRT